MKLSIQTKKIMEARFLVASVENHFQKERTKYNRIFFSGNVSKRDFSEYDLDKQIRDAGIINYCADFIVSLAEFKDLKKIFSENMEIENKHLKEIGAIEHHNSILDFNYDSSFVEKAMKFLKPIIAKKFEKDLIESGFFQKSVWLDSFRVEFAPLIKHFENQNF